MQFIEKFKEEIKDIDPKPQNQPKINKNSSKLEERQI